MQTVINDVKYVPPRIIPSVVEGFNVVASHIYIILFPICLDLFLWLGPLVKIKKYFFPLIVEAAQISSAAYGEQAAGFVESTREIWSYILDQFNLLFSLRTFPVGSCRGKGQAIVPRSDSKTNWTKFFSYADPGHCGYAFGLADFMPAFINNACHPIIRYIPVHINGNDRGVGNTSLGFFAAWYLS